LQDALFGADGRLNNVFNFLLHSYCSIQKSRK